MAAGNQNEKSSNAQVWAAIITGTVSIIIALLAFPPVIGYFNEKPTQTPIIITATFPTEPAGIITAPLTPIPTETFTSLPPTETAILIVTSTSNPPLGVVVQLSANKTTGKAPLRVNFSAKGSYYIDSTGTTFPCGACNYTWQIRQGSNMIYGPAKKDANFEFTFNKKGTYVVTVTVCRNSSVECN